MTTKTHRQALALAAMLTATVVTAIVAVGGLTRWSTPAAQQHAPPVASIVQHAPAQAFVEGDD